MLKGIGTLDGIQIGKVYKYEQPVLTIKEEKGEPSEELLKFEKAINKTINDIETIKEKVKDSFCDNELAIFDAHISMAQDPEYIGQIKDAINSGYSALWSCKLVSESMINMFSNVEDEYLKERVNDIKDLSYRLQCNLCGVDLPDLSLINEKVIIVASDLAPADTARLNKELVLGFVTEHGSKSSHSAIMAEALGIPAVVGVSGVMANTKMGDTIIVDSVNGDIIVNPNNEEIHNYTRKKETYEQEKEALEKNEFVDVFKHTSFIEKAYEEDFNVVSAYEYLKKQDLYNNSINDD